MGVLEGRQVDLDWASDDPADALAEQTLSEVNAGWSEGYGVSAEVLQEHGPAGGWPLIRFRGPAILVSKLVHRHDPDYVLPRDPGYEHWPHLLTEDECHALRLDGRDGVGEYTVDDLDADQRRTLDVVRLADFAIELCSARGDDHEADVLRDQLEEFIGAGQPLDNWRRRMLAFQVGDAVAGYR